MPALAEAGAAVLGGTVRAAATLAGGDLSQVLRIVLADGRVAVVKSGPAPHVEAAMLCAIAARGVPAPEVLAVSDSVLVLRELPGGGALCDGWGSLGVALARLHSGVPARYGWETGYAFGGVTIDNGWADDWPTFWAVRRLLTHCAHIPPALARRAEKLARDLANRLPAQPVASLLHGDLWGGNVMTYGGHVTGLIDPACYFGDAEVDIAMLGLFDRPGPAFFAAYGKLAPGAAARLTIYRLWPALVHLRLFGATYRPMVEGLLTDAGV